MTEQPSRMGSTFIAATEAMQTAVNAMVAAAEALREQAQKYEEQPATQPRYQALLAPNPQPSSGTRPAVSRLRRGSTSGVVDLPAPAPHLVNEATIPTSNYGRFSDPGRPKEHQVQSHTLSRSRNPDIAAALPSAPLQRFDYGHPRDLTPGARRPAAATAAENSREDSSMPLAATSFFLNEETLEPPDPPAHWPFTVAPEDSTRTLCPVDHALELEARHPHDPEDDDLRRMDTVDTYHPQHPDSVYTSSPRNLDTREEPLPVLRIGRYTYIRSDTGDFNYPLLEGQPQQQRQSPHHHYQHQRFQRGVSQRSTGGGGRRKSSRLSHYPLSPPPSPPPARQRPYGFSLAHEVAFVALICAAQLLMLSGMAQALVPQYLIGRTFAGTTPGDRAWYSAAYGLTAGTFVLPSGRLGDVFGHKRVFMAGWVWFGVWELVGGFSPYVERGTAGGGGGSGTVFFIVCRALQGLGPALLVPNGQAMLGMAYHEPGPRKNLVMCLFGAAAPLGFVVGAVMSSLFAQVVGRWEWGFYAMAIACAALTGVSFLVLPPPPAEKEETLATTTEKHVSLWTRLDAPGILLGVAGMVLFNFAFNQAPIVSWATPYTYFLLVMGVMLLGGFVYHERRTPARHALVPVARLDGMTAFVLGCTAAGWACFSIWCYYAFSFLQELRGWSALLAAGGFAPAPPMGLAASLLTGWLFGRRARPQWILLASMAAFFSGSLLWATAPVGQAYWLNCFFGVLVMPFGMDMSNPAASILLSNSLPRENQGIAASLVVTTVNYSISVALGVAGSAEAAVVARGGGGGHDVVLAGYRAGQYVGLGFGAFGILLAGVFLLRSKVGGESGGAAPARRPEHEEQEQAHEAKIVV